MAANVRRLRRHFAWSTRAFAEHTGLSLGFLYRIEACKHRTLSLRTLDRLAAGFGVHVSTLVTTARSSTVIADGSVALDLVSQRLIALRSAKGWTQERLAAESGVARSVIADIERRGRNPSLDVLARIVAAFGLPVHALLAAESQAPQRT